jgi:hypothetical protein
LLFFCLLVRLDYKDFEESPDIAARLFLPKSRRILGNPAALIGDIPAARTQSTTT